MEKAGRVADFLELRRTYLQKMPYTRNESCGGHFREESVEEDATAEEGEAKRDDTDYATMLQHGNTQESHPML